jgi:cobalamin biosynthesis Mg chelatase CobN
MAAPAQAGAVYEMQMQNTQDRSKSNIRLAIILGLVALGFFLLGLYLSSSVGE